MDQQVILQRLTEAADTDTSWDRVNEIIAELTRAARAGRESTGQAKGFAQVVESVFGQLMDEHAYLLPSLLPVFVIICGDRKNWDPVAYIDLDLLLE